MDAWKKCVRSAGKTMSIKFLVLGGGDLVFFFGGGSADFIFMGARIFLSIAPLWGRLRGVLTCLKRYRAIWGIAVLVSHYRAPYRATRVSIWLWPSNWAEISEEKHFLFAEDAQGIQWTKAWARKSTGQATHRRGWGHWKEVEKMFT